MRKENSESTHHSPTCRKGTNEALLKQPHCPDELYALMSWGDESPHCPGLGLGLGEAGQ